MLKAAIYDVMIIGAGAAGLMCAIEAGKRDRHVLVLDHANKPGKKILMSGGGRCNFTNYHIHPDRYLSHNPHFCKSALSRYTQWDFIDLVKRYGVPFHEKTQGQLFCDQKSKDIVDLLLAECDRSRVTIQLQEKIERLEKSSDDRFFIKTNYQTYHCNSLVVATGGLSIPTLGASPFGYQIAQQFGVPVYPTRAGLVPLTWHSEDKLKFESLSGISTNCLVTTPNKQFQDQLLFTHRGLSGPAILQISSYWHPGEDVSINLIPNIDLPAKLQAMQQQNSKQQLATVLATFLPARLVDAIIPPLLKQKKIYQLNSKEIQIVNSLFTEFIVKPNGTEGYRTAEVTLGGVDCNALSSKTMESTHIKGLYFIGEVVDVSGWLGGYNFQWAWSSGWAAGQVV